MKQEHIETDVLVIGGGIAGSTAALILGEKGINTTMISKGQDLSATN